MSTPTNIDIPLEDILSSDFDPSSLTKLQLRSLISEVGDVPYEDLPAMAAKKDVHIDAFNTYIRDRKSKILKAKRKVKAEGKGIVVVNQDGTLNTTTGTPIKRAKDEALSAKKVEFDLSSGYFSEDNPFQSPSLSMGPSGPVQMKVQVQVKSPSRHQKKPSLRDRPATPAMKKTRGKKSIVIENDALATQSDVEVAVKAKRGRPATKKIDVVVISDEEPKPLKMVANKDKVPLDKKDGTITPARKSTSTFKRASSPLGRISTVAASLHSSAGISPRLSQAIKHPIYQQAFCPRRTPTILKRLLFLFGLLLLVSFGVLGGVYYEFLKNVKVCLQPQTLGSPEDKMHILGSPSDIFSAPFVSLYQNYKAKTGKQTTNATSYCWPCPLNADCRFNAEINQVEVACHSGYLYYEPYYGLMGPACLYDVKSHSTVESLTYHIEEILSLQLAHAIVRHMDTLPDFIQNMSLLPDKVKQESVLNDSELKKILGDYDQETAVWLKQGSVAYERFFNRAMQLLLAKGKVPGQSCSVNIVPFGDDQHAIGGPSSHATYLLISTRPHYRIIDRLKFAFWTSFKEHWIYIATLLLIFAYFIKIYNDKKS